MRQAGQEATSSDKPITEYPKNISEAGYRSVCFNARSIVNKKNELNTYITYAELGLTGHVMFRRD